MPAKRFPLAALLLATAFLATPHASAGNPRFVTGTTFAQPGQPMAFFTSAPAYFTDPGALSQTVTHTQADTVVAAAAAVWNVPSASLTLAQGGVLAEHISSANTYFNGVAVIFPSDASAPNFNAIPIAVIYDTDGSITDLLLGEGASAPSSCRQNEVTESVDSFGATGSLQHALLILNGRCVQNTTDSLNQLQYDVMRGFGRILGLGWSQLNDNVFTASPAPTAQQMAYWPVMHPIDVICGPYTYACMQNPFVLRPDDVSQLATLYPVTSANLSTGKQLSTTNVLELWGLLMFPDGYGMDGVNLTVVRSTQWGEEEPWLTTSALTGLPFQRDGGNPVTGPEDPADNVGYTGGNAEGYFDLHVPMVSGDILVIQAEAVNPLYTGAYALGSSQRPPIALSGNLPAQQVWPPAASVSINVNMVVPNAPTACSLSTNGSETYPYPSDPTGWWNGLLCGPDTPAWNAVTIRGGRSWTLETTATDETGDQTTAKAQLVLGVWNSSDPTGTLPTVASMPVPMNSSVPGMTQLPIAAAATTSSYRLTIAEAFGGGRPDFTYSARILYADAVAPASLGASGGQITLTGTGFAPGNSVLVNGVACKVLSWSSTQIVATAPTLIAAKATTGVPVDVEVLDLTTGGTTDITSALTYTGGGIDGLAEVSAPSSLQTGVTSTTPFAVKVLASDGVTPVPGASVRITVTAGSASLTACAPATTCLLTADAAGIVGTNVTGLAAGTIILTATEVTGGATLQISLTDADPVRSVTIATPAAYVAAGATAIVPLTLNAIQSGQAAAALAVTWTAAPGLTLSSVITSTNAGGLATNTITANALAAGAFTAQGCAWTTVCATWQLNSVAAPLWTPTIASGVGQSVPYATPLAPVVILVTDGSGHALQAAPVTISQTIAAWEGVCPPQGRCPAAPILASSSTAATTDANGLVTITPLQIAGIPQVVNLAITTGPTGFLTLSLVKTP
jgi:hypothetical protein